MKFLALHLPQYHSIDENDEWWGKGFTDWNNVKTAKPLYKGHKQPVVPFEKNYYDMTNIDTFKQQSKLADEYGLYGFCYYHYWFNGKLLLEKPCENLLKHPEVKNHYCFCWANESWTRTWDGKENEILIKQTFGGMKDWKAHIEYLLPFFKDERYIKKGNKPVMFFYSCSRIDLFNEMISFWNEYLQKNGFDGIYVAEFINTFNNGHNKINSDAVLEFEPLCTARYHISAINKLKRLIRKKTGNIDFLSYDYIWKCLLKNNTKYNGKKILRSGFVGFDNSPRKGKRATIIRGATPDKFKFYLDKLVHDKSRDYDDDFVVLNAWNEWAEGAVLEPTEFDKYGYLEAIKQINKSLKDGEK